MEEKEQHTEELVRSDRDKRRHTSHTLVLDSGRRTDWQHCEEWEVKLLSELEWFLLSQE